MIFVTIEKTCNLKTFLSEDVRRIKLKLFTISHLFLIDQRWDESFAGILRTGQIKSNLDCQFVSTLKSNRNKLNLVNGFEQLTMKIISREIWFYLGRTKSLLPESTVYQNDETTNSKQRRIALLSRENVKIRFIENNLKRNCNSKISTKNRRVTLTYSFQVHLLQWVSNKCRMNWKMIRESFHKRFFQNESHRYCSSTECTIESRSHISLMVSNLGKETEEQDKSFEHETIYSLERDVRNDSVSNKNRSVLNLHYWKLVDLEQTLINVSTCVENQYSYRNRSKIPTNKYWNSLEEHC